VAIVDRALAVPPIPSTTKLPEEGAIAPGLQPAAAPMATPPAPKK
jgi:hypothetical protein